MKFMLAPGGLRNARQERDRQDRPRRRREFNRPDLTLTQAMSAGKWELLLWLRGQAKTASHSPSR